MQERRRVQRTRVLKGAKLILNHRTSVIDCTVRNLTNSGACIQVASTLGIPNLFDLAFGQAHASRHCRVMWRSDDKLGVAFE